MDPTDSNTTLNQMRLQIERAKEVVADDPDSEAAEVLSALIEDFQALDSSLSAGGPLPTAWDE